MINGKYSYLRYSANDLFNQIEISDNFLEDMRGVSGLAVTIEIDATINEIQNSSAVITASLHADANIFANIYSNVKANANIIVLSLFEELANNNIYCSQNLGIILDLDESVKCISYISYDTPISVKFMDEVFNNSFGSKDIIAGNMFLNEIFAANANANIMEESIIYINTVIPPGGELRIDSENYTVLLNGENILYSQSGEWPILSRELKQITIDSASGGELTGTIVLTARWL